MWNEGYRNQEDGEEAIGRTSTSSDVMVVNDMALDAVAGVPAVSNLNITRSSRVHIGPKFVSVTQNVSNTEVVKGSILGLELVSAKRSRRLRCSIAVFVCWAFLVASGLALYLIYVALPKYRSRLDLDIEDDWYLRRIDWQAMNEYELEFLELPVKYVIIGHTAGDACTDKYSCIEKVLGIQKDHLQRGWSDIGPNFLVGGNDGFVFEGRGANILGVMVYGWNKKMISVMFIGNYVNDKPKEEQFEHVNVLLEKLVENKILDPNYALLGHCQIIGRIISPGPHLMHELNHFSHFNMENQTQCLGF